MIIVEFLKRITLLINHRCYLKKFLFKNLYIFIHIQTSIYVYVIYFKVTLKGTLFNFIAIYVINVIK